jgi:hypothetical protein
MLFRYAGATMAKLFGDDAPLVRRASQVKPFAVTTLVATAAPYRPLG